MIFDFCQRENLPSIWHAVWLSREPDLGDWTSHLQCAVLGRIYFLILNPKTWSFFLELTKFFRKFAFFVYFGTTPSSTLFSILPQSESDETAPILPLFMDQETCTPLWFSFCYFWIPDKKFLGLRFRFSDRVPGASSFIAAAP